MQKVDGVKDIISFQVHRNIVNLYKRYFEITEDLLTEHRLFVSKIQKKLQSSELDINLKDLDYFTDEKFIIASIAQNQIIKESEFLASEIQNNLDKVLTIKNRGVKQAGFYVLHGINMPSVLIELGFITNKKDVRLLNKSRYRQKMAEAIFRSVVTFKEKYEEPVINKQ